MSYALKKWRIVARTFLSASSRDIPVPCFRVATRRRRAKAALWRAAKAEKSPGPAGWKARATTAGTHQTAPAGCVLQITLTELHRLELKVVCRVSKIIKHLCAIQTVLARMFD